jgi:hypothetical protein
VSDATLHLLAGCLGLLGHVLMWGPLLYWSATAQQEPPAASVCGGPDGKPCGCGAPSCHEPCSTCCPVVPCPINDPTACGAHR